MQHTDHIITMKGFWNPEECDKYIRISEAYGYEAATVQTDFGQRRVDHIRNNKRVQYTNEDLALGIWEAVKDHVPNAYGKSTAIGLNERFRFYKYGSLQEFKKHRDQSFIRNASEASFYTFMIYLNDGFTGGTTEFNDLKIVPEKGMALIFRHDLEHAGNPVEEGVKYVLRTDIMFRLPND
ncbi:2OG-Fe(II) oxygenase [Aureisphaera galaxeae]|uniref:2OG-Fe(II) oxygenase n=1 Tax=Aureisphaera galaxeae TaxID=1538023 RepID=UPI00235090C7|nr:2OG-Fe(II) oxygenase [Aureisphaera galaxeae]MDC8003605.1 2OG-Fe(II) oxygenase [Aureisphaera galaxeae]